MIKEQFPAQNLAAAGYGELDPVAKNDTDQSRELNRGIEIIFVPILDVHAVRTRCGSATRHPKNQIRNMASELAQDGIVRTSVDQIELAPASIDDRLAIADLADCYADERSSVIDVLRAWGRAS